MPKRKLVVTRYRSKKEDILSVRMSLLLSVAMLFIIPAIVLPTILISSTVFLLISWLSRLSIDVEASTNVLSPFALEVYNILYREIERVEGVLLIPFGNFASVPWLILRLLLIIPLAWLNGLLIERGVVQTRSPIVYLFISSFIIYVLAFAVSSFILS